MNSISMINNNNQYNDKLSEVSERYNRLASLQNYFKSNHNLTPIIGAEIEFYLSKNINVRELASKIGHDIKLEKGKINTSLTYHLVLI